MHTVNNRNLFAITKITILSADLGFNVSQNYVFIYNYDQEEYFNIFNL